jgi:ribonucleoside-diphosphate reductase alpha chain
MMMRRPAVQQHLPWRRHGHTTTVTIGGERFYLTANAGGDGTLGELFIQWGKQGQGCSGLVDAFAISWSLALRHGVPLTDLIRGSLDLHFLPSGRTDDPQIPHARSIADYTARRLAVDWLPATRRADLGIRTIQEKMDQAGDWMTRIDAQLSTPSTAPSEMDAWID